MAVLAAQTFEAVERRVNEVLCKAEGVFLWVNLVVKSLLKGLGQRDSISDLMRRLEVLPDDLESLYEHMLQSTDSNYKVESSKLFQLH